MRTRGGVSCKGRRRCYRLSKIGVSCRATEPCACPLHRQRSAVRTATGGVLVKCLWT